LSSLNRRAILIGASPNANPIPSVYSDVARWSAFLLSSPGGAWREEEIVQLTDCDRNALRNAVSTSAGVHYSLVVFAGYGKLVKGKLPWDEAQVTLRNGDCVAERELNPGTPSCTLIFDCWASVIEERGADSSERGNPRDLDRDSAKYRALYDQSVMAAESGLAKVYALAQDGVAAPNETFSQHLLAIASRWAADNHGVLSLQEGVSLAAEARSNQRVEYHGGRRLRHFPLAVRI